jgi:hypothetical protein
VSRRSECNRVAEDRWVLFVTTDAHLVSIRSPDEEADLSLLSSTTEPPVTVLAGSWIELGTEREGLL